MNCTPQIIKYILFKGSIVSLRTEQSVNRTPQSTRAEDHMTQGVLPKKFSF